MIGSSQTLNSINFMAHNKLRLQKNFKIPELLFNVFAPVTGIIAGIVWPISLPLMLYYDQKWNNEK